MAYGKKFYPPKKTDDGKPAKKKWNPNWAKKPLERVEFKPIENPSKYQQAFFDEIEKDEASIVLSAVPGSGKTTSLINALYHQPPGKKTILLAFNTDIANVMASRCPQNIESKTNHSIGMRSITRAFGKVEVDKYKGWNIAVSIVGDDDAKNQEEAFNLQRAMDLSKCLLAETSEEIDALIDRFEIDIPKHTNRSTFISNVQAGLEVASKQTKIIDFADMIYLPNKLDLSVEKYDRVYLDEMQDLNPAQSGLVMKMLNGKDAKFVGVGQREQAIYGWAGASVDEMNKMIAATSAKEMPLSICYRCPKRVVELCASLVPGIEPSETAEDGILEEVGENKMLAEAKPGDFILSRVNAPLVSYCLAFLREGRRAKVAGRDMSKSLLFFVKNSEATTVDELIDYTEAWKVEQCQRLEAKKRDCTHIIDKAATIMAFAEDARSIDQVKRNIEALFDDKDDSSYIILSSTHRAKGKEVDRVWALKSTFKPDVSDEERNLAYVCYSRSKKELYLVD